MTTRGGTITVIGIEEHFNTPDIARALDGLPAGQRDDSAAINAMGDNRVLLEDLGAERLAFMDAHGVDMQVIALAPPATQGLPVTDALPLSRHANDVAADAVRANPSRLRAMATLPLADPAAAAAELERAAGLGLVGTMVYGRTGDVTLDDPRYEDLFATAAVLGQPIFIHPQIAPQPVRSASYSGITPDVDFALATYGWGWHLEAAVAALRVIARGTLDRHPDLQLVLGHWGELLLFWSDRTDSVARAARLERTVSEYLRSNFYITSSGMLSPSLLRHTLEVTTVDRLIFSTDYPFQRPSVTDLETFLSEFSDDEEREKFTFGNARTLFRITGPE